MNIPCAVDILKPVRPLDDAMPTPAMLTCCAQFVANSQCGTEDSMAQEESPIDVKCNASPRPNMSSLASPISHGKCTPLQITKMGSKRALHPLSAPSDVISPQLRCSGAEEESQRCFWPQKFLTPKILAIFQSAIQNIASKCESFAVL